MIDLVEKWADHFGYYGRIDTKVQDLSSFATPACTLTAHAPLWRTKAGEEQAVPVAVVRNQLAKMQRTARVSRHDMHMALHPDGDALALFFRVEGRLAFVPFTMMKVPLVFVVQAVETDDGLRINEVDEWRAPSVAAAKEVVVERHGWPSSTTFEPVGGFGAAGSRPAIP